MGVLPKNCNIYISTQTACSDHFHFSLAVYAVTGEEKYAKSSIRISLSHLTTKEEIDQFVKVFTDKVFYLTQLGGV